MTTRCRADVWITDDEGARKLIRFEYDFKIRYLTDYDLYASTHGMPMSTVSPLTASQWIAWRVLNKEGQYRQTWTHFLDDLEGYSEEAGTEAGEPVATVSIG